MTIREELKTVANKEEWQKLIAQSWMRTVDVWIKKRRKSAPKHQNVFWVHKYPIE